MRPILRSLARDPVLAGSVIVTFALAIGANAAMYGLVSRLMLSAPPGVAQPQSLVRTRMTTSFPVYEEIAARAGVIAAAAAVRPMSMIMGEGEDARAVQGIAASGSYFRVLGARPAIGRFFSAEDDQLPSGNAVVVLSHAFWKRRHAGDAGVLGSTVTMEGQPFTIIGVAAPDFSGDNIAPVDVFVPLSAAMRGREAGWWADANVRMVDVIARLREGVTAPAAAAAVDRELDSLVPSRVRGSSQARIARWLLGVSVVVLLIATANVGTLLLLRALKRRRDIAVRIALGAGVGRLALQLAGESLVLATAGGSLGLLLAGRFAEVVRSTLMPTLASTEHLVNPGVLLVTIGLSLAAGLLAGLAPMALIRHRRLAADLTGAGTIGSVSRARMQTLLVGVQVSLCTVLLIGAGLFVRSLQRVRSQDLGYSPARLLLVQLDFRERLGGAREDAIYRDAVNQVRQLAGVTEATVVQAMPFGNFHVPPISVPGLDEVPTVDGQPPFLYAATPEYLRLMDVRLVRGRLFTEVDTHGPPVVLVNETFARRVWPGQDPLGKCVRAGHDPELEEPSMVASPALPCRRVVGVVRDSRARSLRPTGSEATLMQYYVPFEQVPRFPFAHDPSSVNGIIVGTHGEPARMATVVQRLIQGSAASPVYARVQPYQELIEPQLRPWKLGAALFVAFGALALAIAAIGLFGVVSYVTSQRTREIGLRLALGGSRTGVARSVVGAGVRMVALGIAVGIACAVAGAPRAESLLFETTPRDLAVLAAATSILLFVAVLAAVIPALRAARVSPMIALRVD